VKTAPAAAPAGGPFWTGELEYRLPPELVAQVPAHRRDASRLMVLDGATGTTAHASFADLGRHLPAGALLVANDSRVIRARLRGVKRGSGGAVEALLLGAGSRTVAPAMIRVAKPLRAGQHVDFGAGVSACIVGEPALGRASLDFAPLSVDDALARCGELPLPPYIERAEGPSDADLERYQTVYARSPGSVAAPTAGLHFTKELIDELASAGFDLAKITLHVGPGTFSPVRGSLSVHRMEEERYSIDEQTAARIARAKEEGRPVVAVGTTTVRALESAAQADGVVRAGSASSGLFIRPGHRFRAIDALVTNFHLPGSTLLALVMALAGRDCIERAYEAAVAERYHFYSYGDAMLIR
jgi:S-adenosylmethionine:tRNA ribosyltransferase-isomerase